MSVFFAFIVSLGWFVGYYYENIVILPIAIIFSLVMNIASYWYSDKISLALAGAHPANRLDNVELYRIVENLSITAGLPLPGIYIIDDMSPNAFATGRDKDHAAIAVTTGLIRMLDKTELEGVIAHELSHIGNRDTLLQTVVVVLVGFVSILAHFFTRSMFLGGNRRDNDRGQLGAVLAIVGVVFVILSPIIAQIIQLAISRKREFLADASGALMTRYPEGLASALLKISSYSQPLKNANNATAHLFISNPFGPKAYRGLAKLFMTHPPTEERVAALRGMKA
ncbi:MAG: M48 family metallopeptidase [Candidatus Paceibacterota bacterium]|jgi:heat shock protein HtpX